VGGRVRTDSLNIRLACSRYWSPAPHMSPSDIGSGTSVVGPYRAATENMEMRSNVSTQWTSGPGDRFSPATHTLESWSDLAGAVRGASWTKSKYSLAVETAPEAGLLNNGQDGVHVGKVESEEALLNVGRGETGTRLPLGSGRVAGAHSRA